MDDRIPQVIPTVWTVATDDPSVAIEPRGWLNRAAVQRDQSLHHFPDRTGPVCGFDRAIEQRFVKVGRQLFVVVAAAGAHEQVGVKTRSRQHGEDLPGVGFNGHHAPLFVAHELLGELLQGEVQGECQIQSGLRGPVFIGCPGGIANAVARIHQHGLSAFDPP